MVVRLSSNLIKQIYIALKVLNSVYLSIVLLFSREALKLSE